MERGNGKDEMYLPGSVYERNDRPKDAHHDHMVLLRVCVLLYSIPALKALLVLAAQSIPRRTLIPHL